MPVDRMCRCSMPSMRVARVAAAHDGADDAVGRRSSCSVAGAFSRFSATAVASISMWPISSVAVLSSMSRYLVVGPRAPQPWKKYCMQTRISPSMPPIACCSMRAKIGSGLSTFTGYWRRLS